MDLTSLKRYDGYCSYDGGGPAEMEEATDGQYVLFSDVQALLATVGPQEPQAATPEDYREATQDTFCDAFCTWRDHHPECKRDRA